MKTRTDLKLFLLVFAASLCFVFEANAQNKEAKAHTPAKTGACKPNDISFRCPEGLTILSAGESIGMWISENKEYEYGLFVVSPKLKFEKQKLINETKKTMMSKLFPQEPQNYKWKKIDAIWMNNSESKHQQAKQGEIGFNNQHSVLFKYQHILFNGKNIFVGYAYELSRGADAKRQFEKGLGGGSAPACQDLVEIVFSITGEKLPEGESPCTLTLITGSLN